MSMIESYMTIICLRTELMLSPYVIEVIRVGTKAFQDPHTYMIMMKFMIISLLLQMSGSPLQAVDSWCSQKISSPSSRTTTKDWLMFSEVRLQPLWRNQSAPGLKSISEWQLFPLTIWLFCTECWCPHQHTRHVSSCSVTATAKPASSVRSSDSEKGV
jgi:hypothetical protein